MTRSKQHMDTFKSNSMKTKEGSFMYRHLAEKHPGKEPNMKIQVEKTFHDNLTRQIT